MQWLLPGGLGARDAGSGDAKWCGDKAGSKLACRICHCAEETPENPLVAPCLCDGSLRYVHNACQQTWLRARPGSLDYRCELCRARLACRLTPAVRVEVAACGAASIAAWSLQLASVVTLLRLANALVSHAARAGAPGSIVLRLFARLLPSPTMPLALSCVAAARAAVWHLVLLVVAVSAAHGAVQYVGKPLRLAYEPSLARFCAVKIGACVLVAFHELLQTAPPLSRPAPHAAWAAMASALVLDTLLLAFLRVATDARDGRLACRLARLAWAMPADFLPYAGIFFLWSASLVMVVAATALPFLALLLHEAATDVVRWRHRHGSVQLTIFFFRGAARLAALAVPAVATAAAPAPTRLDLAATCLWFLTVCYVALDIKVLRWSVPMAHDGPSMVMWTSALIGQALLRRDRQRLLGAGGADGGGQPCWPWIEELAFLVALACYLAIHLHVFADMVGRVHQSALRFISQFSPDQVIFRDRTPSRFLASSSQEIV